MSNTYTVKEVKKALYNACKYIMAKDNPVKPEWLYDWTKNELVQNRRYKGRKDKRK
jgi:hypothetical protein